jgi:hypothetical protein
MSKLPTDIRHLIQGTKRQIPHVAAAMQVYDTTEWFTGDFTGNGII